MQAQVKSTSVRPAYTIVPTRVPGSISTPSKLTSYTRTPTRQTFIYNAAAVEAEPSTVSSGLNDDLTLYTLTTWLLAQESSGKISGELATVISSVALACKQISSLVSRSGIAGMTGLAGEQNVQGEDQKKLDVISNIIFSNCLKSSGRTSVIASEEEDQPIAVEETYSGDYVVVFDPLDGSSNIDAGISVGSIFGIYEPIEECPVDLESPETTMQNCILNVQQSGNGLVGAGYCLYSSATILVLSIGDGVYGFTLDNLAHEFVLSHRKIQIPESGKIYSFNEGNYGLWDSPVQKYMDSLKDASLWGGKPYSARYIGSLVGDFHRTLLYGGIYGYPSDAKNANGKLRLLYECAPMSYLAEQAGGSGSTGTQRVLDITPEKVHQRVPLYIGSKKEVDYLESFTKSS